MNHYLDSMTTSPLFLLEKKPPMLLQCRMGIPLAGKKLRHRLFLSKPVSPLPRVGCGGSIQLDVSLLKLQEPSLTADWHVFPEFSCWPRGTCHIGNNVSKLQSCQGEQQAKAKRKPAEP